VYVVQSTYEHALALAAAEAGEPGVVEIADAGADGPPRWVIDGYATLFAEAAAQGAFDLLLVPVGVGSLAAAAVRFAAAHRVRAIGVEPVTAACLTASLAAGAPTPVATPGTSMAGLDCAEVSPAAWPELRAGLAGTVTVSDPEVHAAMRELAAAGLEIGDCGAAPLAALRALATEPACAELAAAVGLGPRTRVLLLGTEGVTDPDAYRAVVRTGAAAGASEG
jgi:diaminopropionate ammonia-lyase